MNAQILGVEHWSLLAARGALWQEIFSRTGTFLAIVSASVVALSLMVQATGFGQNFRVIASLVLPLVLLVGLSTYTRLLEADLEDLWLVIGMNRLRHAYLDLLPGLEPYFVTGYHDDWASLLQTYGFGRRIGVLHLFGGSAVIVGVVNSMISGVIAVVIATICGAADWLQIVTGVMVAVFVAFILISTFVKRLRRFRREFVPRFPKPAAD
ncbi:MULTISPECIES: hypothetical protein [Nocardiaceae]|uniref:hypothetical protein n=3 Tax=Mycobacteriales TaxID=85007 RepID=UPI00068B5F0A|nr:MULTISPECIES: hypothetical protein [Rhodococcus]OZC56430.1 hypothetical protein CH267_10740 [Rhodococcus sp. 06-621-2]OZD55852.1 hypothetical protein CH266_00570 [Rhodococcus sp. 06-1474-1B]